jgi:diguanylate cyclase
MCSLAPGTRVGGDEFVVVLPAVDGTLDIDLMVGSIADRILRELTRPIEVNGVEIRISASIGIAISPDGGDVDALVASADAAMYDVKRSGGSGHHVTIVHTD